MKNMCMDHKSMMWAFKLSVISFTLIVMKIWTGFSSWVMATNVWWFVAIFILATMKCCCACSKAMSKKKK